MRRWDPALRRTNIVRTATVLVASVVLVFNCAAPARADLINGVCVLDVTITFTSPPTLSGPSPGYSVVINAQNSGCTLDSLDSAPVSGHGDAAPPTTGSSDVTCGVLAGSGTWNELFGTALSPVADGSHTISGTWLEATMAVSGAPGSPTLKFNGVIQLRPRLDEPMANAHATDTCRTGGTVNSIRMRGVEVFNDPDI